jgi:CO/xanthine dehydrogenase FAD-binding subunit
VRNAARSVAATASGEAAADVPVALLALSASVHAGGWRCRCAAVADLLNSANTAALRAGELITALPCRRRRPGSLRKFVNPAGGYALVGVAVTCGSMQLVVKGCSVAVTGITRRSDLPAAGRHCSAGPDAAIKAAAAAAPDRVGIRRSVRPPNTAPRRRPARARGSGCHHRAGAQL